ncbi:MAG: type I-C CRISPR-associated protein Cas7/Csd2 [Lachnoclostridium sp.]|jgi:CRISPR-associated protein Csd2|nr:type I-C CRISPR-associated protein Cas7/Csd2 [Lachnoclostridium sp.]
MSSLSGKIDFVVLISANNANPNGDPLNGNRPRENFEGFGEISDVCIKRKIRNRLQDEGEKIFVQSDERSDDGMKSLKDRADNCAEFKEATSKGKKANKDKCSEIACKEWMDVRSFGQVFAFKGDDVSLGVRGPVSIHQAVSVSPVDIISMQITKSVNSESKDSKASDTMGMKHRVEFGLYVVKGSINCQLAEKTGFSDEDAEKIKAALCTLFTNDSSSARPEGSMEVCQVYWWKHSEKTPAVTTAMIHRSVNVKAKTDTPKRFQDYDVTLQKLDCIEPEVYNYV